MEQNKQRKSDRKGYIPLKSFMNDTTLESITTLVGKLDTNKVNALNDIIGYCKTNKIQLHSFNHPYLLRLKPQIL